MRINPFRAWRPTPENAKVVASPPYDVVDSDQARQMAAGNPQNFLHVVRAEIDLPEGTNLYDDSVYAKAAENLEKFQSDGTLVREESPCLYLYSQRLGAHTQNGIVAGCHIDDYISGKIKIHEKTRKSKEADRTRYVEELNANTGPVFLAYRTNPEISEMIEEVRGQEPFCRFTAADGSEHTLWRIEDNSALVAAFENIPEMYVADGHHRSASAVNVGQRRRAANPDHAGDEPYNWFMAVLFPADQLQILAYNRIVFDLGSLSRDAYLQELAQQFELSATESAIPAESGQICMYMDGEWQLLTPKASLDSSDPVARLDVSILQDKLLAPILGIEDPRESENVDFIGGFESVQKIERAVDSGKATVGFSLYPTRMDQLMSVADANELMPPKSTWFAPKLCSGLLVNTLD